MIDLPEFTERCLCCEGSTNFDWFEQACDDCAEQILVGQWIKGHPHGPSEEQREALR